MAKRIATNKPGLAGDTAIHETPGVCGGYPCIGHTRIPVRLIVEAYRATGSLERTRELYPMLTLDQVQAALHYYTDHPGRVDEDIARNQQATEELAGRRWPA